MSDVKNKYRYVVKKIKDDEYVDQTFIGLTEEAGRYQGVIYSYGKVSVPRETEENPDGTSMIGIIEIKHEDLAGAKVNFGELKWNELGIKSLTMSGKISLVRERLNIQKPVRKR